MLLNEPGKCKVIFYNKAFETPHANKLWMADLMFGPTLKLASGQVLYTRLFALLG